MIVVLRLEYSLKRTLERFVVPLPSYQSLFIPVKMRQCKSHISCRLKQGSAKDDTSKLNPYPFHHLPAL
jgi:hypothetical protein